MTAKLQQARDIAKQCRSKLFSLLADDYAIVTTDPLHVGYVTGYRTLQLEVNPAYLTAAVVTKDAVAIVTGAGDCAAALEFVTDPRLVYRYGTFFIESRLVNVNCELMPRSSANFSEALLKAVSETGGTSTRVAVDAPDAITRAMISGMLNNQDTVDARPIFLSSRAVKLDCEIEQIAYAAKVTEDALSSTIRSIDGVCTELTLASTICAAIVQGGGSPRGIVVAAAERSALVDVRPSQQVIAPDMLVRFDIAACFNGYWVDIARSVVAGRPTDEQSSRYAALLSGQNAAFDLLRPGAMASDIYKVAMRAVQSTAIPNYRRNHCGHSIGIAAFEAPVISSDDETVLQENMVFCLETPYYELGWGGMTVEDMAVVTKFGCRRLTQICSKLDRNLQYALGS